MTNRITKGTRQVVITANSEAGPFSARLWVNVREDDMGDATLVAREFKSLKGAEKWANAELAK